MLYPQRLGIRITAVQVAVHPAIDTGPAGAVALGDVEALAVALGLPDRIEHAVLQQLVGGVGDQAGAGEGHQRIPRHAEPVLPQPADTPDGKTGRPTVKERVWQYG